MAKPKAAKKNTAAYAASQPLLDAITYGQNKVLQQKQNLSSAGDIVRNIHVQVPSATGCHAAEDHGRSLDAIVAAWRNATEAYTEIFDSLAKLSAADPSIGRGATKGHEDFKSMAETARTANKVASEWTTLETPNNTTTPTSTKHTAVYDAEDEDGEDSKDSAEEPSPTNDEDGDKPKSGQRKPQNRPDKIWVDSKGHKHLWDVGAKEPYVPYASLGASEKKAWKYEQQRQKREKKRDQRQSKKVQKRLQLHDGAKQKKEAAAQGTVNGDTAGGAPAVQYEDVSAEVEARLKAKEEKKKAKKGEKKRKRESGDSAMLEHPITPKKKAKGNDGAEKVLTPIEKMKAENAAVEKRKQEADGAEVNGQERRKRKKTS